MLIRLINEMRFSIFSPSTEPVTLLGHSFFVYTIPKLLEIVLILKATQSNLHFEFPQVVRTLQHGGISFQK